MEDLQQRAPDAHLQLSELPQEIQEDAASRIGSLAHDSLMTGGNDLVGPVPKKQESLTPQEAETQDRITGMMSEVARLTDLAHKSLVESGQDVSGGYYEGAAAKVFRVAKDIAVGEALAAQETGDTDVVEKRIQNLLVLELLHPGGDASKEKNIGSLVVHGMVSEVISAASGMNGVISTERSDSVTQDLSDMSDMLRISANLDFDETFQNVTPLVAPGMPDADVEKKAEIIDKIPPQQLSILAQEASESKSNPDLADYYAQKSLDSLTKSLDGYAEYEPESIVTILTIAETCLSNEHETSLQQTLNRLNIIRTAGLKPYRINNRITGELDSALVLLASQGKLSLAKSLLSVSGHELMSEQENSPGSGNLDFIIQHMNGSGDIDDEESKKVHATLLELQTEKVTEFRTALAAAGASDEVIDAIIENTNCPDTAQDIPAEFWDQYNKIVSKINSDDADERLLAKNIEKLLTAVDAPYDLARTASTIERFLQSEAAPELYKEIIIRQINALQQEETDDYISKLTQSARILKTIEGTSYSNFESNMDTLIRFKDPEEALQIISKIYGDDAAANIYKFSRFFETDDPKQKIEIEASIKSLLSEGDFVEIISKNGPAYGLKESLVNTVLESNDPERTAKIIVDIFNTNGSLWHTTSELSEIAVDSFFYCQGATVTAIPTSLPIRTQTSYEKESIRYISGDEMLNYLQTVYGVDVASVSAGAEGIPMDALPPELQKTLLTAYLYEAITISRDPDAKETATTRNAEVDADHIFQPGNLHHFTSSDSVLRILNNGLLPGEFVADQLKADSYPFNADFVESTSTVVSRPTYEQKLEALASSGFGMVTLHFIREESSYREGAEYAVGGSNSYDGQHRLIPGGFPATEIAAVTIKSDDILPQIRSALLEAGIFIPVFSSRGEILFSYDQYLGARRDGNYDAVVPEIVDREFKRPDSQTGSNDGAEFIVPTATPGGTPERYYCKFADMEDSAHLWSELLADELYRIVTPELVPETRPVIIEGRLARASKMVAVDDVPVTDVARNAGFIMDSLVGNWDATYNAANLIMSGGNAMRIDTGNALFFRAQGGRKQEAQFGETVTELEIGDDRQDLGGGMRQNYPGLSQADIEDQITVLQSRLTDAQIDRAVDGVRFPSAERERIKTILKQRRDYIIAWGRQFTAGLREIESV